MKQRIVRNKSGGLSARLIVLALAAMLLGDGATNSASAQLTTADCLVCHTDAFWLPYQANGIYSAAASAHHGKYAIYGCAYCHRIVPTTEASDNCTGCHGIAGHQADHDKTAIPSTECATCHLGNVYNEHAKHPATQNPDGSLNCAACHDSTNADVQAAIAKGRGPDGQIVYCEDCHVNMTSTHEASHDKTFVNGPECLQCHVDNVVTEHVTNRGWYCSVCHSSTEPAVLDAIARGRGPAGVNIICSDCHGMDAISHQAVHDQALLPTVTGQDCTQCHAANVVTEHVGNRGYTCAICHSSTRPEVLAAIENGRTPNNTPTYCIACHAAQGNGHPKISVEPWNECLRCHKQTNFGGTVHMTHELEANNDCALCHAPVPNCTQCHNNNSADPWLDIVGPGDQAHDRHTDVFALACNQCHVSGVPGGTPLPAPYDSCDTCHATLQYGKVAHNSHMAAAGNECSVCHTAQPDCGQCHAPGHPAVPAPYNECDVCHDALQPGQTTHNSHRTAATDNCALCHAAQPDCGQCHAPGHPPIPAPYDACDQCHTSLAVGQLTHDTHVAQANQDCALCHNAMPDCGQCHSNGNHAADHDHARLPSTGCATCHDVNVVVEHVTKRNLTCAVCHDNPAYAPVITTGKSGTDVTCYDCHTQNQHHALPDSQAGKCTTCHTDPRLAINPNAPQGQLACRQCHGTTMHDKGGPIQDYGACFACHAPAPYHAKPATRPIDCYSTAPGKGSFNLFFNQFGGAEEHNERNENCDDRRGNYSRPAISYSMVTIFDYFTTNKQWSVPTFGTAAASDKVTITKAEWTSSNRRIQVYATNTLGSSASLTMKYGGKSYPMSWNSNSKRWEKTVWSVSYYSTVEVVSSKGGSATATVTKR